MHLFILFKTIMYLFYFSQKKKSINTHVYRFRSICWDDNDHYDGHDHSYEEYEGGYDLDHDNDDRQSNRRTERLMDRCVCVCLRYVVVWKARPWS